MDAAQKGLSEMAESTILHFRFLTYLPTFMMKFSFNNCSVWPRKCCPIFFRVLSSRTILASRLSCFLVSCLLGLRDVTAR